MEIIDITQELFTCRTFPGDSSPQKRILRDMKKGDLYNLSDFSMCSHNGTHVDAPAHFIADGATVDRIPLDSFIGPCYVAKHDGDVTGDDARRILDDAGRYDAGQRILIKGEATVTAEAARVFAEADILLVGNESQTVGPEDAPMAVHLILLSHGIILLEGVDLSRAQPGRYFLSAAPLNLGGLEGAPCRAWLGKE